jgi:hypothetical protein
MTDLTPATRMAQLSTNSATAGPATNSAMVRPATNSATAGPATGFAMAHQSTWRALASVPGGPRASTVRGMRSAASARERAPQSVGEVCGLSGLTERGRPCGGEAATLEVGVADLSLDEGGQRKHRRERSDRGAQRGPRVERAGAFNTQVTVSTRPNHHRQRTTDTHISGGQP